MNGVKTTQFILIFQGPPFRKTTALVKVEKLKQL